ncbi:FAD-binding domain-containing protein [Apiospora sp. TS-2023a]
MKLLHIYIGLGHACLALDSHLGAYRRATTNSSADLKSILNDDNVKWSSPHKPVIFPGDADFAGATTRWSTYQGPTYRAAVRPESEEDVKRAVRLARDNGIPFLATGGRHGYATTLGKLQGGLAIDLSKLNTIKIDKDASTLTVGPGVHFGEIFGPVFDAGFMIPTGTCSCVGVIGATIGAGIGRLSGIYGLLVDQLVSARVVTADGQIVEASNTSHPDLFWGIRGAGANFGVLTSATYKLSPIVNGGNMYSYDMVFPAEKSKEYWKILASFDDGKSALPAKLAVVTSVEYDDKAGKARIMASWVYYGTKEEAEPVVRPVLDLGPTFLNATVAHWTRQGAELAFGIDEHVCEDNKIYDIYTVSSKKLDASTMQSAFEKMVNFYEMFPGGRDSTLTMEVFPTQGNLKVPNDATAYPWRDAKYNVMVQLMWEQPNKAVETPANRLATEIRDDVAATSGYGGLAVYVNYGHGDEKPEQIYGAEKLRKLASIKKTWDPKNLFAFSYPIPR